MMNWKMTKHSTLQPHGKPFVWFSLIGAMSCLLLFSGCVAQKADLQRVQKDLEDQISKLNRDKQELEAIIAKNREEAESLQAQQGAAMKDLFRARAEIRQELKALREADITTLTGDIDEVNFKLTKLRQDLDAQATQTGTRFQAVETQVDEQGTQLTSQTQNMTVDEEKLSTLIQQIDEDSQTRNQQFSEFRSSLSSFKESMAGLGNQLVQETERATQAQTDFQNQVDPKIDELKATLGNIESQQASLQTELQTQKTNVDEVSSSISQIRQALEQSGTLVGGQVTGLESNLKDLESHVNALTEKLNTDTQALRSYLEQDVKTSINSMTETVANQQRPLVARLDTVQDQLQGIEAQTMNNANQTQELTQSFLAMKEKQELIGGLLGERGDKLMQESGRLSERLNLLETHQADLTQKMETNTQSTGQHLAEVNTSLTSMRQALENTSAALASRLESQEQAMTEVNSTLQGIEQLKASMEANLGSIRSTTQSSNEMRQALEQINTRIQELEVHQSGLVGKLDADGQTMNSHLAEVNSGIQSVADAVKQVEGTLRSRIDEQDRKLNEAVTDFQSAQSAAETSQANLNHLNQITLTINQLRDVVDTIGTKLGGRVDQHESRLSELAKRVNLLSGRGKKKKKK